MKHLSGATVEPPEEPIPILRRDRTPIASFGQERLWRYAQRSADRNLIQRRFVLRGRLDVAALERAIDEFIRRHEIMRTTFAERDGRVVQIVHPATAGNLVLVDLSGRGHEEEQAAEVSREVARRGFHLERGPLLRVLLIRHGENEHTLAFILHHLTYDARALEVLDSEVGALYAAFTQGRPSPLETPRLQMADFAAWQRHWLRPGGGVRERQLDWWKNHWSDELAPLRLPFAWAARPERAEIPTSFWERDFPQELYEGMKELCRAENVTLYTLQFAALAAVLHELTGSDQMVIGTYASDRQRPGMQEVMGFFVNLVAVCVDLRGAEGFRDLVHRLSHTLREVTSHQELPFEELCAKMRELERPIPNIQVIFQHIKTAEGQLRLPGIEVTDSRENLRPLHMPWGLTLSMVENAPTLKARVRFDAGQYDPAGAIDLVQRYEALLAQVVAESRG